VLDRFWEEPALQQLHPDRGDFRSWVRWNLDLVIRWLTDGQPPTEEEIGVFREHARARVAEGFPPDIISASFRRGARCAWRAIRQAATEAERAALVESAEVLFEYVDRVSRVCSEVHESATKERRQRGGDCSGRSAAEDRG
jgi:hypothetical protein